MSQDQVEEELAPIKTQPLFQVFTDCPGMNTTLNRIKAFLYSSTKATTPAPENPEKIDSEALQIAKRSNVISVLASFGSRMLPKRNANILELLQRYERRLVRVKLLAWNATFTSFRYLHH